MTQKLLKVAGVIAIAALSTACGAPRILGKATFAPDGTAAAGAAPAPGVTVNFINLAAAIEESVLSVQTDAKGQYRSPELTAGQYTVEAMLPGYVIGKQTVTLKKHGKKKVPFTLTKIREAKGKSVKESEKENIPTPGEVKIGPPWE